MRSEPLPSLRDAVTARHRRWKRKRAGELRRRLMNTVLGIGAFVFTCGVVRALLPFPHNIDQVSAKLEYFTAHKDEFDALFIGSSRVRFQISPAVFDGATEGAGAPTKSFNFGVDGMHLPESGYVLEQALKARPRNLKWVFVELDELQTNWLFQGESSRRALYWHDRKRTSLVLRKLLGAGTGAFWLPNPKKVRDAVLRRKTEANTLKLLSFHSAQFQKNATNVARAADVVDLAERSSTLMRHEMLGPAGDGFVPITKAMSREKAAAYNRAVGTAIARARAKVTSPYTEQACRQCAEAIRAVGAVPIFVVTPVLGQSRLSFAQHTAALGAILSFNDASRYPALYRSDIRMDQGHMTMPGAEEFTRLLAAEFSKLLRAGQSE